MALDRIRAGRPARSFIFYGLRGVGKTVLLNRIRSDAEARGFAVATMEAPEGRSLPGILAPALRSTLNRLSRGHAIKSGIRRAGAALAGFIKAFKLRYDDVEVALDFDPEPGLADSGDLEIDLIDLFVTLGAAARERNTGIGLFVDELQYVTEDHMSALVRALHRISQDQLPIVMIAAGLPQLVGLTGGAKSYAERLFEFVLIDRLRDAEARDALCTPAELEGVRFKEAAVVDILEKTQGYPYFLQAWGKHCWEIATKSPITFGVATQATTAALAELDAGFFRVRLERLTPNEKRYLRAMAELGSGPHRSGMIAKRMERRVTSLATVRESLIAKGMIYSPAHGDTAFTVPLFDDFMKRTMPDL